MNIQCEDDLLKLLIKKNGTSIYSLKHIFYTFDNHQHHMNCLYLVNFSTIIYLRLYIVHLHIYNNYTFVGYIHILSMIRYEQSTQYIVSQQ